MNGFSEIMCALQKSNNNSYSALEMSYDNALYKSILHYITLHYNNNNNNNNGTYKAEIHTSRKCGMSRVKCFQPVPEKPRDIIHLHHRAVCIPLSRCCIMNKLITQPITFSAVNKST